jgi:hypothetical protein
VLDDIKDAIINEEGLLHVKSIDEYTEQKPIMDYESNVHDNE